MTRVVFAILVLFIAAPQLTIGNEFVKTAVQPHIKRTGKNLVPNAAITGAKGWKFAGGAAYDASISRTKDGSGALKMGQKGAKITSRLFAVEPGKTYTMAVYMRENGWPPQMIRLVPQVYTASGKFKRNARAPRQAVAAPDT